MQNRSSTSATLPARIGRFEVRALLGAGGFGSVYRAHDPLLGREVALKVAHPGLVENPAQRERFLREGRAAARLRHPHLVPVFDAGCEGGTYYMAAAYVEGKTLATARKQSELDLRQSVAVVRQLAEALAYAHRQGIVHRDVKPANVLLDARNEAHLTDFGIAHQQGSAEKLTHDGAILGTPAYMAPEQAAGRQGDPLPASDQYSLGVVLYELLTGQTPFTGPPVAILHGVLHQQPEPPRKRNATVPRDLERICLKTLAKRPEDRYANCQALADDLRRFLEGEAVKARPLGLPERAWRWGKREPRLAAATAAAALSLLAAVLVPLIWSLLLAKAAADNRDKASRLAQQKEDADAARIKANEKRAEAVTSREKATKAAALLTEETRKAEEARKTAAKEADKATAAKEQAERRKAELPRYQYAADIQLAQYALEAGAEKELDDKLDNGPGAGKQELRGFEWRHLRRPNRLLPVFLPKPEGPLAFVRCLDNRSLVRVCVVREQNRPCLRVVNWDLAQRKEKGRATLDWYDRLLDPLTFLAPDSRRMIQRNDTEQLGIVGIEAFEKAPRLILRGHNRSAAAASFARDNSRLATLHKDDALRIWDIPTGKVKHQLPAEPLTGLALSPDGKTLATAIGPETTLWDAEKGTKRATLRGAGNALPRKFGRPGTLLEFSADSKLLATAANSDVTVWDVDGGQLRATLPTPVSETVTGLPFSPDGKSLLTRHVGPDPKKELLTLWEVPGGKKRGELTLGVGGRCAAVFSPAGKTLAFLDTPGSVLLWDIAAGERRLRGCEKIGR